MIFMSVSRVPFEMDSSVRYASIVFLEISSVSCAMAVVYWIIIVFIEFMLHMGAFVEDIKSTFGLMDQLAKKSKNTNAMVDHCKEIVDLMCRMNR